MLAQFLTEQDDAVAPHGAPHLSHSRISKYLTCPEQYRLYYLERLRPKVPAASLVFGQVVHQCLAVLFHKKGDPVKCFLDTWGALKEITLAYNERESWEKLKASGEALLIKFVKEELSKITMVRAVEQVFEINITSLDAPFVGVIDLKADVNGKPTVVDFKAAGAAYEEHEAPMSDQLTAYQLGEPDVEQLALCVLVKTKEPKIEWHFTNRTGDQLTEYLTKVGYVARDIAEGRFFKRPGKHCSWCDFLPLCLGDRQKAKETLVAIP